MQLQFGQKWRQGARQAVADIDAAGGITARIAALMRSRYTRTAFASAMLLAIAISGLVLKLSSPEIVYKQF